MIHSVRFTAVLDTNVIYPVISRDILFWFAHYDLFTPKWSDQIFDEWKRVMLEKGVSETADDCLTDIIDLNPDQAIAAFKEMVMNKKNPKQDDFAILNQLRNAGIRDTANYLHAIL